MELLLDGLKVLSFGQVISAPSATRLLADLGADVIKVEPRRGEMMRGISPLAKDRRGEQQSGFFTALNCGKRGIALDMKHPEGQEICRRLALEWADVVVENFTPGTMESFGLDYETLSAAKPSLVYASLSGYGQDNPMSRRKAYDLCVQSEAGLAFMNGEEGERPHRIGYSVSDYGAGRDLVVGVLAAVYKRDRTGRGQHVDVAMYDTCVSFTENAIPRYSLGGEVARAMGSRHPAASPHNLYRTRDGFINIIAIENRLFAKLAAVMGRPDLVDHPVFGDPEGRRAHMNEMDAVVEAWTSALTTKEAADLLANANLPYGILHDIRAVVESEHTQRRDMAPLVEQTDLGPIRVPGCPIKVSGAWTGVRGPAPLKGEHNREVLAGILGYTDEQVRSLEEREVIKS